MLEHIYDVLACAVLTLLVLSVVYELCTHWFFFFFWAQQRCVGNGTHFV